MARIKNEDVGMPAVVAGTQTAPRMDTKTRLGGDTLVPNLTDARATYGVSRTYLYWVGITPSAPVGHLTMAGICFPKINELLIDDPMGGSIKRRVPVIGSIVPINEATLRRLMDRLPRTIIRFYDDGEREEPGTGKNMGDLHQQPRRGQLITIPSKTEVEARRQQGRPTREYVPSANDVPAARYMFAQLCADQKLGSRGDFYPETLETAGFEWPDELN